MKKKIRINTEKWIIKISELYYVSELKMISSLYFQLPLVIQIELASPHSQNGSRIFVLFHL